MKIQLNHSIRKKLSTMRRLSLTYRSDFVIFVVQRENKGGLFDRFQRRTIDAVTEESFTRFGPSRSITGGERSEMFFAVIRRRRVANDFVQLAKRKRRSSGAKEKTSLFTDICNSHGSSKLFL